MDGAGDCRDICSESFFCSTLITSGKKELCLFYFSLDRNCIIVYNYTNKMSANADPVPCVGFFEERTADMTG